MTRFLQLSVLLFVSFTSRVLAAQELPKAEVEIGWDLVRDAVSYEVEFTDSLGNAKLMTSTKNSIDTYFACGIYSFKARSINQKGTKGPWGTSRRFHVPLKQPKLLSPEGGEKIVKTQTDSVDVNFTWKGIGEGVSFKVLVYNMKKKLVKSVETQDTKLTLNLPVAQRYTWKVQSSKAGCPAADVSDLSESTFDLIGGKLASPKISRKVYEIRWDHPRFAQEYEYTIEKQSSTPGQWKSVQHQGKLSSRSFLISRGLTVGVYRVKVVAKAPFRADSDPGIYVLHYDQTRSFQNRVELQGAYMLVHRHFNVNADGFQSRFDGYITNTFALGISAYYKSVGVFFDYQEGSRRISFVNQVTAKTVYFNLSSFKTVGGLSYEYNIGDYGLVSKLGLASETLNTFSLLGPSVSEHQESASTLYVEIGPKFDIRTVEVHARASYETLLSSKPFHLRSYSQYGVGISFDQYLTDYLTIGAFIIYNSLAYSYIDTSKTSFQSSLTSQRFGLVVRWIIHK